MQESLIFLILGVGRLREDQLMYVGTRENMFFYDIGTLKQNVSLDKNNSDFGNYYINIYSIYFDFLTCALLQSYLKKNKKNKNKNKTKTKNICFFFFFRI